MHFRRNKTQGSYDAFIFHNDIVHHNAIHSNQTIFTNSSSVNNGSVTNVRTFFQTGSGARKHVNRTIFLHIATVFNNDLTPITANSSAWTNINVFSNDNVSDDSCQGMNKATFFDYRLKAMEFINRHCELFTKVTIVI